MTNAPADSPLLRRLALFIVRRRRLVIGVWLVLTIVGVVASGQLSSRWYQSSAVPGGPGLRGRPAGARRVRDRRPRPGRRRLPHRRRRGAEPRHPARPCGARRRPCPAPGRARTSRPGTRCTSRATGTRRSRSCTRPARRASTAAAAPSGSAPPRGPASRPGSASTSPAATRSTRRPSTARAAGRASSSRP